MSISRSSSSTGYSNLFDSSYIFSSEIDEEYPCALAAIHNANQWTADLIRENPIDFLAFIKNQTPSNYIWESAMYIYRALLQEHFKYRNLDLPSEIHRLPNGGEFQGNLKEGKPHGRGIYKFANGDLFAGDF